MKILSSLFILMLAAGSAWAQGVEERSGIYQNLNLGVDAASGILTGYYQDGPDDADDDNQPDFTCVLYLYGKKEGGKYSIQTYKPKDMSPALSGELSFVAPKKETGKLAVRLKLNKLSGGCWKANPSLGKPEGSEFSLAKAGHWSAVRIVKADKAYFFESPEAPAPKKIHLKRGDVIVVTDTKPGWVFADNLIRDKGWLKEGDLFSLQP